MKLKKKTNNKKKRHEHEHVKKNPAHGHANTLNFFYSSSSFFKKETQTTCRLSPKIKYCLSKP